MADPDSLPASGTPTENGIKLDQLQQRPHPPQPQLPPQPQVQPVPPTQQSATLPPVPATPVPTPPAQQSTRLQPPVPTPPTQQSTTLQPPVAIPTTPHSQISPQQAPTLSSVTPTPVGPKPKRARKQTGANNKTNPIAKPEPKRKASQKRSQPTQSQIQPVQQAQQSTTLRSPVLLPVPTPATQQSTRLQPPVSTLLTQQSTTLQLPITTPPLLQSIALQPPIPTSTPPHSLISPQQAPTPSSVTASPAEPKPKRVRKQTGANNKTNTLAKSEPKRKQKDTPPKTAAPLAAAAAPLTQQLDPISPAVFASAFEELRDNVWSQVSRYVIELAQHFDIPSLIGTLYTLRQENDKLVNKVRDLTTKRDQLIAMNARLDLPGPMLTQHLSHTSPNFSTVVASLTSPQKPAGPLMAHGANNCGAHNNMFK